MSGGKASDWKVRDESRFDGMIAKRPLDGSFITLSSNTTTTAAVVGDVVGTLSITGAYVGTPHWQLVGQSDFAVNATTGVVTVASTLNAGSEDIKVKVKGTTPPISSPTFAISITGGGGGSYVAKAVHFDGSTYINNIATLTSDSGKLSFSGWILTNTALTQHNQYMFDLDPPSLEYGLARNISNGGITSSLSDGAGNEIACSAGANTFPLDLVWHHWFGYLDGEHAQGLKIAKLFLDAVDITGTITDNGSSFVFPFSTTAIAFPDDPDNFSPPLLIGDVADWWIAPGLVETDITIFRDPITGKPKNPSGFPASAVLFSGDSTTFANNQGTGGAFTLTGSLTNATTSPSD